MSRLSIENAETYCGMEAFIPAPKFANTDTGAVNSIGSFGNLLSNNEIFYGRQEMHDLHPAFINGEISAMVWYNHASGFMVGADLGQHHADMKHSTPSEQVMFFKNQAFDKDALKTNPIVSDRSMYCTGMTYNCERKQFYTCYLIPCMAYNLKTGKLKESELYFASSSSKDTFEQFVDFKCAFTTVFDYVKEYSYSAATKFSGILPAELSAMIEWQIRQLSDNVVTWADDKVATELIKYRLGSFHDIGRLREIWMLLNARIQRLSDEGSINMPPRFRSR